MASESASVRGPLASFFFNAALLALGFVLGLAPASALELSDLKIDLENLGADPDASGSLRLRLQENQARFQIRLAGLAPDADYTLFATQDDDCPAAPGAIERVILHTDARGRLNATLGQPSSGSGAALDFDPRGKCVTVHDGVENVLALRFSTAAGSGSKVYERTQLEPTPDADGGSAQLSHKLLPNGRAQFRVGVKRVPVDDYDVCVGDVYRETLSTNAAGVGRIDFTSQPPQGGGQGNGPAKKVHMTFDPYADEVEIWTASETNPPAPCDPVGDPTVALAFSGPLLAQIPGLNVCPPSVEAQVALTGAVGSGEASLELEGDCERTFEVSTVGLADGDYDAVIGGTLQGSFTVSGGAGSIQFGSEDAGEGNLDFDPSGQLVEVRLAGTPVVALSGTLPTPP